MLHVHASHGLKQLAVDMLRASGTTGRHVILAGIRLGVRDELGKIVIADEVDDGPLPGAGVAMVQYLGHVVLSLSEL